MIKWTQAELDALKSRGYTHIAAMTRRSGCYTYYHVEDIDAVKANAGYWPNGIHEHVSELKINWSTTIARRNVRECLDEMI